MLGSKGKRRSVLLIFGCRIGAISKLKKACKNHTDNKLRAVDKSFAFPVKWPSMKTQQSWVLAEISYQCSNLNENLDK